MEDYDITTDGMCIDGWYVMTVFLYLTRAVSMHSRGCSTAQKPILIDSCYWRQLSGHELFHSILYLKGKYTSLDVRGGGG